MTQPITFTVQGVAEEPSATRGGAATGSASTGLRSQRISLKTARGNATTHRLQAVPGRDVLVLHLQDGPSLTLHPEHARALLQAQTAGSTGRGEATGNGDVTVPVQLGWPALESGAASSAAARGATRGWMGQVWASAVELITGASAEPLADIASAAVTQKLDGQVEPGVYPLSADKLLPLKGSGTRITTPAQVPAGKAVLVLIHGTFVETTSTFGKLWTLYPQVVRELFSRYEGRVFALDHRTMGDSPVTNALQLVAAMPQGAQLHLLTHSRGGVVAEVLARAAAQQGLDDAALAAFTGSYAGHAQELRELAAQCRERGITVQRMVRVACPARGTLLASGRLDAYLSVLQWLLQRAGIVVGAALVDFIGEVARTRADPARLPGLAALMPDSPLVAWLNAQSEALASELRVVAGDLEGDSIGSWLKTLMSDAFYWTDNDLVVQTRSMYGGTARAGAAGAQFLLDRGGKVDHFSYFSNERTVQAVLAGLTQAQPEGFATIGPLSWAGEDASGSRAKQSAASAANPAARPALIYLPGILGSNLQVAGQRVWLSWHFFNRIDALRYDPTGNLGVQPDGALDSVYGGLREYLANSHEVIEFAFDWRVPLEQEARRLGAVLTQALRERQASGQAVRLVAHSMGGLLARTLQLELPDLWAQWMTQPGTRLLFLGVPHGGSYTPMQVLSGDDSMGNTLAAAGALFQEHHARELMAAMPGFLQLQAGLDDAHQPLALAATWQHLADEDLRLARQYNAWHSDERQLAPYRWAVPPQAVLDQALALRKRLDAQAATLQADAARMVQVLGQVRSTPVGFELTERGVEYTEAVLQGDGRASWASSGLNGVPAWLVPVVHSQLPQCTEAFAAYEELLTTGRTTRLKALPSTAPTAAPTLQRGRPSRSGPSSAPPSSSTDPFGELRAPTGTAIGGQAHRSALRVQVLHGDLRFVNGALLLGHYRSLELTGSEWVVDALAGQGMSRSLAAGLYPGAVGSHQVFVNRLRSQRNPLAEPQPQAVVVAGLGDEGGLTAATLSQSVRQAVLAYAQHLAQTALQVPAHFDLTATLIGSGGTGVSTAQSAQWVAQGVREADALLQDANWPRVASLTLVEWYADRAAEAWGALHTLAEAAPGRFEVGGFVREGTGGLRAAPAGNYRGARHDLISAQQSVGADGQTLITYTLDTRRARTEVRTQQAQGSLLQSLVKHASNDGNRDPQISRTLFKLLVPMEMEPFLGGTNEMLIELDSHTAAIPWELLSHDDDNSARSDPRPWAIRAKLLRKLRTDTFRERVRDAAFEDHVLVVGEPLCDHANYPELPGARAEALAVAEQLGSSLSPQKVVALTAGNDARSIINALYQHPYRAVHVAGHGAPGAQGGVVLSDGNFLGAAEVRAMRTVPELVFLNCCHLAGHEAAAVVQPYDRAAFAANMADELIRAGVRCVVAAGWAVEDTAAEVFARRFYAELLEGSRFIDAVAAAREAAWNANPQGNTWAAYQCYGDPAWSWRADATSAVGSAHALQEFTHLPDAQALILALDTLAVRARYGAAQGAALAKGLDALRALDAQLGPTWGHQGAVAEAFGLAYAEAGLVDEALAWLERAEAATDGSASYRASEQHANLMARRAPKLGDAAKALADVQRAIARLQALQALQPTAQRHALLGSAYKRLTLLHHAAGRRQAEMQALAQGARHYELAERGHLAASRVAGTPEAALHEAARGYYPALNAQAMQLRWALLQRKPAAAIKVRRSGIEAALRAAAERDPDFWTSVGPLELRLMCAIAARRVQGVAEPLAEAWASLHQRVPTAHLWESVRTTAALLLEPYQQRATKAEREAALMLLGSLKRLAAGTT